jgi:c-di-GMP-binding flagellar brake protein YcgR
MKPPPSPRAAGGVNRRAHVRYEIGLAAEVLTASGRNIAAVTRDLSRGGSCLETAYPLPEGEAIRVHLFVVVDGVEESTVPPMRLDGAVKWAVVNEDAAVEARHVAGIEFAAMSDAEAAWLARFLG